VRSQCPVCVRDATRKKKERSERRDEEAGIESTNENEIIRKIQRENPRKRKID